MLFSGNTCEIEETHQSQIPHWGHWSNFQQEECNNLFLHLFIFSMTRRTQVNVYDCWDYRHGRAHCTNSRCQSWTNPPCSLAILLWKMGNPLPTGKEQNERSGGKQKISGTPYWISICVYPTDKWGLISTSTHTNSTRVQNTTLYCCFQILWALQEAHPYFDSCNDYFNIMKHGHI